jgi:uncharacterized protein involved in exopolysaccharide biosynthesis
MNRIDTQDDEINLLDILQALAENARLLIFGSLIVGLAALGWAYTLPPSFTASTRILPPQQQQSSVTAALSQLGALASAVGPIGNIKNPGDLYVALAKSRTVADRLIDRFKLLDAYGTDSRETARNALTSSTAASVGKDGLITISVDDPDPKRAAAIANAYVDELARLNSNLALTEAQQRRRFLEKELAKARDNLVNAEIELGNTGVNESLLKFNPEAMGSSLADLKTQIVAKEVQLSSMRGYLTERSPDFRQAQQELAALRAQLSKAEYSAPSGDNADYTQRYREFKYNEVLFEQLARQYELAKIDESREGAIIQIVDPAVPPEFKSSPKKARIAIVATLAAAFVLILFVLIRRALQTAAQTPENAAKLAAARAGLRKVVGL